MVAHRTFWVVTVLGVAAVAALAGASQWLRTRPADACALDGSRIDPIYRIQIIDGRGATHAFCCVACARLWLDRQDTPPRSVLVTDESSGELFDARTAYYVRSRVVTRPTTGNCVHVFRNRTDAERHAEQFGGVVLPESEAPFRP
jgi:hypothetical protein